MAVLDIAQIATALQSSKGDVKSAASQIASTRKLDQDAIARAMTHTGDSFRNVQDQINNQRRSMGDIATYIQNNPGVTLAQVLAYLLSLGFARSLVYTLTPLASGANTVNPDAPLYEGDRLAIRVQQNGSGNGTVTFGANVKWCDANYVTNTANRWTVWNTVAMTDPTDGDALKWFGVAPANAEQSL